MNANDGTSITTTTTTIETNQKTQPKCKKTLLTIIGMGIAIAIPYIVGVSWILCHPIISVVTGELKCRGVYIDEHQLDPHAYEMAHIQDNSNGGDVYDVSLIDAILEQDEDDGQQGGDDTMEFNFDICSILHAVQNYTNPNHDTTTNINSRQKRLILKLAEHLSSQSISCHSSTPTLTSKSTSKSTFQVLKIEPKKVPTEPLEALVFVIPPPIYSDDNNDNMILQKSILLMVARIIEHSSSSYLAKTLLFVFSTATETHKNEHSSIDSALEQTVNDFFTSLGAISPMSSPTTTSIIPSSFDYTKYIIRQLIILDIQLQSTPITQTTFQIIPNGSNGQLPNLDFLTATLYSYQHIHDLQQFISPSIPLYKSNRLRSSTISNMKSFVEYGISLHSYKNFTLWWDKVIVSRYFPNENWWQEYGIDLGYMFSFMIQSIFR